jgi:N-acetylneuraminic acid mutarotase
MPAVVIDGIVYVPGGFLGPLGSNALEAYDVENDRWQRLESMPQARHHLMAAAHAGKLYVFGGSAPIGFSATSSAWRYDPALDSWEKLSSMPEARMSGAAVTLGDTIYIVGGAGDSQQILAFEIPSGDWRLLPGPAQPREHTAAAAYQGELWIIGGRWSSTGELRSVEIYDPVRETWRSGADLLTARGGFAVAVLGSHIFVAGGEVILSGRETLASVEIYNPELDEWEPGPALPFAVHGVDGVAFGGQLLIMGGSDRAAGIQNEGRVQIYGP